MAVGLLAWSLLIGLLVVLPGGRVPFTATPVASATWGGVTTLAGTGSAGQADGVGGAATFNALRDLAVDATGEYLYALDLGGSAGTNKIRKISTSTGEVSTFAGGGLLASQAHGRPTDLEVGSNGDVWVAVALAPEAGQPASKGIVRYPAGGGAGQVMVAGICCDRDGQAAQVGNAFAFDPEGEFLYYGHSYVPPGAARERAGCTD